MSERVKDTIEVIKGHPASRPIIGVSVLIILFLAFCSDSGRRGPNVGTPSEDVVSIDSGKAYPDIITMYEERVTESEKAVSEMKESIDRFKTDNEQIQGLVIETLENFNNRLDGIDAQLERLQERGTVQQQLPDPQLQVGLPQEPAYVEPEIQRFEPDPEEIAGQAGPKPEQIRIATITAGDAARVTLLTGVNAPVDGTPYPVVFKLTGPITGPDGSVLELGEARLLALATGSEIDSRAVYRLQTLAMRFKDGRRAVVDVDGWVVGEDGIRGMQGRLVDKLGSFVLQILGTSFVSDALAGSVNGNQNININGGSTAILDSDNLDNAFASSLNDASQRLIDVYIDRLERMVPVVEVLAGREAAAVFSVSVEVFVCEQGNCGGDGSAVFAQLD